MNVFCVLIDTTQAHGVSRVNNKMSSADSIVFEPSNEYLSRSPSGLSMRMEVFKQMFPFPVKTTRHLC